MLAAYDLFGYFSFAFCSWKTETKYKKKAGFNNFEARCRALLFNSLLYNYYVINLTIYLLQSGILVFKAKTNKGKVPSRFDLFSTR